MMIDENAIESTAGLDDPTLAPDLVHHDELHKLPTTGSLGGEYEILNEIARGAMGIVYRAKHQTLARIVALKMILEGESPLGSRFTVTMFHAQTSAFS